MARLAGLALRDRWAEWDRSPFTGESTSHVSVWQTALNTDWPWRCGKNDDQPVTFAPVRRMRAGGCSGA